MSGGRPEHSLLRPGLTVHHTLGPGAVLGRGTDAEYRAVQLLDGESHSVRDDLGPGGAGTGSGRRTPLLCFVHVTDLQLADVQSPVRFEFLNREFEDPRFAELLPVQRPQEAFTPHAVEAMLRVVGSLGVGPVGGGPVELAVTTGDAIDNAQWNEVVAFLDLFEGGRVDLTGGRPYIGVQSADWPDDVFWRPDGPPDSPDVFRVRFGFPLHQGVLDSAVVPFDTPGLALPWLACYGNHEALLQGVGVVTEAVAKALVGDKKPSRLPDPFPVDEPLEVFVAHPETFLQGDPIPVPALADRRAVGRREFVDAHFRSGARPYGHGFTAENRRDGTAFYVHDVGAVRFLTLDTACLAGGAEGCVDEDQVGWLTDRLVEVHSRYTDAAGSVVRTGNDDRLVVLLSHHGVDELTNTRGGHPGPGGTRLVGAPEVVRLLHRFPNVVLWVNGHTHTNGVLPRPDGTGGGFWEVTTCAVADWPCQARIVELLDEGDGTLTVACTMVDHDGPVTPASGWAAPWDRAALAGLHRELAGNTPWAGWDSGTAGGPMDRNVLLRLRDPRPGSRPFVG